MTYTVDTDLVGVTGLDSFEIKKGKKYTYNLNISPVLSGSYTGSITFTKDDGSHIWYTVVLETNSPKAK